MGKKTSDEAGKSKAPAAPEREKLTINKWDGAAVKNALDDTAKKIVEEEYEFVEDFTIVDHRLFLCTLACCFSVFGLIYDYLFPFPSSEMVLAGCAISYFLLMGVLSVYSVFCEGSVFMLARKKDPAGLETVVLKLSSTLPRFSHTYSISVSCSKAQSREKGAEELKESVTEWFDEEGTLMYKRFREDFRKVCVKALSSLKTD